MSASSNLEHTAPQPSSSAPGALPVDLLMAAAASTSHEGSSSGGAPEIPRAPVACLQCRRLKSRCHRDTDPQQPCKRCKTLGLECEVVRSRRGRKLGSRNKRVGLEKSLAHVQAVLDRIRDDVENDQDADDREHAGKKRRRTSRTQRRSSSPAESTSTTADQDPLDYIDLDEGANDLPLESCQSPELDRDGEPGNPLAVLSSVGKVATEGDPPPPTLDLDEVPGWTRAQLQSAAAQREVYFHYRPSTAKRDVAQVLDPVGRFVAVDQAEHYRKQFFAVLQPQLGFMDPSIYTLTRIRERSALLTTVILATGAAHTTDIPEAKAVAEKLYKHAERLIVVIVSRNAKSQDIVVALLALSLWPRCPKRIVDGRSRMLLGLAINIALELGMNRDRPCNDTDEVAQKWHRDYFRTWIVCMVQDKSLSAFSGKPSMLHTDFDLDAMDVWFRGPHATPGDAEVVGFMHLRSIESDARAQLRKAREDIRDPIRRSYAFEAIRMATTVLLEGWVNTWVTPELVTEAGIMRVLAHHVHLLITTATESPLDQIIHTARASLKFVLEAYGDSVRHFCRTVSGMLTWAAVLLLRYDRAASQSLVRDVALALAPYGDGRLNLSYTHFYGSFLLGLCLNISKSNLDVPGLGPEVVSPTARYDARTLVDVSPLSADAQLEQLIGLNTSVSTDLELPWDVLLPTEPSHVNPPLEWLLNDPTTGDDTGGALWGYDLAWSQHDGGWNANV